MYNCARCGYSTTHKGHFKAHLEKKTLCPPKVADIPIISVDEVEPEEKKKFKCDCCSKKFSSEIKLIGHKNIMNEFKRMQKPKIIINYFGNENTQFITSDIVKSYISRGTNSVIRIIEYIYFNKEHPENHNIRLRNIRNQLLEIYTKDGWIVQSMDKIFEKMIDLAKHCITTRYIRVDLDELDEYRFSSVNHEYYVDEKECDAGFQDLNNNLKTAIKPIKTYIRNILIRLSNNDVAI